MGTDSLLPMKGKRLDCMIKLIATDMDGTLLDERGEVDLPQAQSSSFEGARLDFPRRLYCRVFPYP